jgi:putative ABC transport system permease protein
VASSVPFGWINFIWKVVPDGDPERGLDLTGPLVDSGYFEAMGLPFLKGATFVNKDSLVINATAANRLFGARDPIGELVDVPGVRRMRIAGVVEDSRLIQIGAEAEAQAYLPIDEQYPPSVALIIKTRRTASSAITDIRSVIVTGQEGLAAIELMTMSQHIDLYLARARMMATVSGILALIGLTISVAGTALIATTIITARAQEAAIRLALGVQRWRLFWLLAGHELWWGVMGIAVGVVGAKAIATLARGLLVGVEDTDPFAIATSIAVVLTGLGVGAAAAARSVTSIDPAKRLKPGI